MKTMKHIGFWVLAVGLPLSLCAGQQCTGNCNEHSWTGTLKGFNAQQGTVTAEHWGLSRSFRLGKDCSVRTLDKKASRLDELMPGEKLRIRYQKSDGVMVANQITEKALRTDGTVKSIDPKARMLVLEQPALYRPFRSAPSYRLAQNCKVQLYNGHSGTMGDVKPGDHIALTYEVPRGSSVVYRLNDQSASVVGTLDTLNLPQKTLKAKGSLGQTKFAVGDPCEIILPGDKKGHLNDLQPGQQYRFTYQVVNGVNILARVAPAQMAPPAETASAN